MLREFARFLQKLQIIDVMDVEPDRIEGGRKKFSGIAAEYKTKV